MMNIPVMTQAKGGFNPSLLVCEVTKIFHQSNDLKNIGPVGAKTLLASTKGPLLEVVSTVVDIPIGVIAWP